ncbi:MAG TPA: hypothetical protein VIT68_01110 [Candidatus Gracilibacteria bacterium]
MDKYPHRLGIGLIPSPDEIKAIYGLSQDLTQSQDLSFFLQPGISIPHLTLFQGKFSDESAVIKALSSIDLSSFTPQQIIKGISVWAQKIVFLDCLKSQDLADLHTQVFKVLFPLCEGTSADPQNFQGITEGQQKAFEATGYPFSREEYLPHFTLAHLSNPQIGSPPETLSHSKVLSEVHFTKLVVYRVGDLGACLDFAYEKSII